MNQIENLKNIAKTKLLNNDPAHDLEHIMRVYRNAEKICKTENGNKKLVLSAVLLHDIVKTKNRKDSAIKSAKLSEKILKENNFFDDEIRIISDAIKEHSFSKGKIPSSIEGKILQDADRLDAIGAVGLARVFSFSGSNNRPFYDPNDPFSKNRVVNDNRWALDHFFEKLLTLEKKMNTKTGKILAKNRTKILKKFLKDLKNEI
ncbi:MAG: HD domain-containing protein [Crenarchaeota archaeon]|nr:HD domain-containing protein [Thermoproteota archaeon]MDA1124512.1 HD domain-containing protein [Thermoproteota archaeon]